MRSGEDRFQRARMSPLPQRRKSPEEIALLRESLGIPSDPLPPETATAAAAPALDVHPSTPQPIEHPIVSATETEESLSAPSTISPTPRADAVSVEHETETAPMAVDEQESALRLQLPPKPNSPRNRSAAATPSQHSASPLPARRRSHEELEEIRRREALAMIASPVINPRFAPAHPALLASGYLAALACAGPIIRESWPIHATVGCAIAALLIATCIVVLRPISKHHAAFITILTLLFVAFAALHHFPQLQYAP
jgi:hypothetical protein